MSGRSDDMPLDALDAMYECMALDAAEHGQSRPRNRNWAASMKFRAYAQLAELRALARSRR